MKNTKTVKQYRIDEDINARGKNRRFYPMVNEKWWIFNHWKRIVMLSDSMYTTDTIDYPETYEKCISIIKAFDVYSPPNIQIYNTNPIK